jgi:hypothetical protein
MEVTVHAYESNRRLEAICRNANTNDKLSWNRSLVTCSECKRRLDDALAEWVVS